MAFRLAQTWVDVMPIGTEKNILLGASAGGYEYGTGQSAPGYSVVSGWGLASGDWYSACGNGGSGTWSWSQPVCPTQNPDSPGDFGGYHGTYYRNQPNAGTVLWAYSDDGASWTNLSSQVDGYVSVMCGAGYRNWYCNNSGEVFAPYWRCTGNATTRWDFAIYLFIKW